jgi:hypothetical protein
MKKSNVSALESHQGRIGGIFMVNRSDLRSKLTDGVLAGGVLVMLELVMILLIQPIQLLFLRSGILVYTVVLIALAVICLERCLALRDPDMVRAWWGILGGMVTWAVIELSNWLGSQIVTNETGILIFLFVILMISVLWRRIAPLGLRYFFLLAMLGWLGHAGLASVIFLIGRLPQIGSILLGIGYAAVAVIVVAIVYIMVRSQTRLERINAAIAIWSAAMVAIYVFRGGFM